MDYQIKLIIWCSDLCVYLVFFCVFDCICRAKAMLKLLEKLNTPQQISLVVASVIRGAYALSIDTNGQHIVNYCIKRFPREYTKVELNYNLVACFTF